MKDLEVTYSVEALINTGNFENVKVGYTAKATADNLEERNEVAHRVTMFAEALLEKKVDEIREDLRGGQYRAN